MLTPGGIFLMLRRCHHPTILLSCFPPILLSCCPPILLSFHPAVLLPSHPTVLLSCRYLMHKMAFFPSTQDIGVTMVMDIGHAGVFESMGIMPAKVKAKCDKLMQGASAIKMIKFCMCRPVTTLFCSFLRVQQCCWGAPFRLCSAEVVRSSCLCMLTCTRYIDDVVPPSCCSYRPSFWMKAMMKFFKLFMYKITIPPAFPFIKRTADGVPRHSDYGEVCATASSVSWGSASSKLPHVVLTMLTVRKFRI